MKQDLTASVLAHLSLFLFLVFATMPGASLPPPIPPDQVMNVTPVDALPAGLLGQASQAQAEPEEVAIEEPPVTEGVKIPEKPPALKAECKPKPKPKPPEKKPEPKTKPKPKPTEPVVSPDAKSAEEPAKSSAS